MLNTVVKRHLNRGQYLTKVYNKLFSFIHHTAGPTAEGAWNWFNQTEERVGTAYMIKRDGVIWELFDPKYWAWHLGIKGDDNYLEKHSINIELVSMGKLFKLKGGVFYFYPLYPNTNVGKKVSKEDVVTLKKPYNGFKYFHAYTDEQIESLKPLLESILIEFDIPLQKDYKKFYKYDKDIWTEKKPGVYTHGAVREDKTDAYPDPRLISAVAETLEKVTDLRNSANTDPVIINSNTENPPI